VNKNGIKRTVAIVMSLVFVGLFSLSVVSTNSYYYGKPVSETVEEGCILVDEDELFVETMVTTYFEPSFWLLSPTVRELLRDESRNDLFAYNVVEEELELNVLEYYEWTTMIRSDECEFERLNIYVSVYGISTMRRIMNNLSPYISREEMGYMQFAASLCLRDKEAEPTVTVILNAHLMSLLGGVDLADVLSR
jgi:hypothetical protein